MPSVNLRSVAESIPGVADEYLFELRRLRELAALDRTGRYTLTDNPSAADLVLFVESSRWQATGGIYFQGVRRDPTFRKYHRKSLVYSGFDSPVPFVRGVFPSIERSWNLRSRGKSAGYITAHNPYVVYHPAPASEYQPTLLASFVGVAGRTPVRRALQQLKDDAILIADNTQPYLAAVRADDKAAVDRFKRDYADTSLRSKFVLCPRGYGAGSIRLFETMEIGRAPVILSDQWVECDGPDWVSFSLRVKERDVPRLPAILREHESESDERGRRARAAWEQFYSPEVMFSRLCDVCLSMLEQKHLPDWMTRWTCYAHFLQSVHGMALLRNIKSRIKRN